MRSILSDFGRKNIDFRWVWSPETPPKTAFLATVKLLKSTQKPLKTLKTDGSFDLSHWVVIDRGFLDDNIRIYPNPTKDDLIIDLKVVVNEDIQLVLTDVLGRVIMSQEIENQQGFIYLSGGIVLA